MALESCKCIFTYVLTALHALPYVLELSVCKMRYYGCKGNVLPRRMLLAPIAEVHDFRCDGVVTVVVWDDEGEKFSLMGRGEGGGCLVAWGMPMGEGRERRGFFLPIKGGKGMGRRGSRGKVYEKGEGMFDEYGGVDVNSFAEKDEAKKEVALLACWT